jgi:hypothetical protein
MVELRATLPRRYEGGERAQGTDVRDSGHDIVERVRVASRLEAPDDAEQHRVGLRTVVLVVPPKGRHDLVGLLVRGAVEQG